MAFINQLQQPMMALDSPLGLQQQGMLGQVSPPSRMAQLGSALGNSITSAFDSPLMDFGLGLLANNSGGQTLGQAIGGAGLTTIQRMALKKKLKQDDEEREALSKYRAAQLKQIERDEQTEASIAEHIASGDIQTPEGKLKMAGLLAQSGKYDLAFELGGLGGGKLPDSPYENVTVGPDGRAYGVDRRTGQYAPIPGAAQPRAPQAPQQMQSPYADVTKGPDGKFYGIDKRTGQAVQIPGAAMPAEADDQSAQFKGERELHQDYAKETAGFRTISQSYGRMQEFAKSGSPADDMMLIVNAFKVQDPSSTVTGNEAATLENARGVPDIFRGWYNRVLRGDKLSPEQRQQLLATGTSSFNVARQGYELAKNYYTSQAARRGYDPASVAPSWELPPRVTQGMGGPLGDPLGGQGAMLGSAAPPAPVAVQAAQPPAQIDPAIQQMTDEELAAAAAEWEAQNAR